MEAKEHKNKAPRVLAHLRGTVIRMENSMTNRIIPSTVQTDYKRPTRMQTIAGCAGFAALAFVPSIIDAALSLVHIPDAAVLALVALFPVALIVATAKL